MQTLSEIVSDQSDEKLPSDVAHYQASAYEQLVKEWLGHPITQELLRNLEKAARDIDSEAKNLSLCNDQRVSGKVMAKLIESKTLEKVIEYGRRTNIGKIYGDSGSI